MEIGLDATCKREEVAIARHGIGNSRSDQKVGVERSEGRNDHCDREPLRAGSADPQSNHVRSNVLGVRYLGEAEQVKVHPVDQEVEKNHDGGSKNCGSWKISTWVENLTTQWAQTLKPVVGCHDGHERREKGDQRSVGQG